MTELDEIVDHMAAEHMLTPLHDNIFKLNLIIDLHNWLHENTPCNHHHADVIEELFFHAIQEAEEDVAYED